MQTTSTTHLWGSRSKFQGTPGERRPATTLLLCAAFFRVCSVPDCARCTRVPGSALLERARGAPTNSTTISSDSNTVNS
eukprot:901525-Rhodomonas_salina.1